MFDDLGNTNKEIREYLEARLDLIKLQAAENVSRIVSNMMVIIILCLLSSLVLIFLSFSAGYYLASLMNSNILGFLCVAGFYLLMLLIILLFRKKIIERPVIKSVVRIFFPEPGDDEKSK
jgi:hypothetical protein